MSRILVSLLVVTALFTVTARPAHAIDKRLSLMFKTGGYGAAGGAVLGTGAWIVGLGGGRSILVGASTGLYAGILLAAYLVATQDDYVAEKRKVGNPYAPKKRAGPRPYEDEEDYEEEQYVPDDASLMPLIPEQPESTTTLAAAASQSPTVWMPVLVWQF